MHPRIRGYLQGYFTNFYGALSLLCIFILIAQLSNLDNAFGQQVPSGIYRTKITRGTITPPPLSEAERLQVNILRSMDRTGAINVRQFSRTNPSVVSIEGPLPRGFPGYAPNTGAPAQVRDVPGQLPRGFGGYAPTTGPPPSVTEVTGPMPRGFQGYPPVSDVTGPLPRGFPGYKGKLLPTEDTQCYPTKTGRRAPVKDVPGTLPRGSQGYSPKTGEPAPLKDVPGTLPRVTK
jgi:hypothetical protein